MGAAVVLWGAIVGTFGLVGVGRAARLPGGFTAVGVLVLAVGGGYLITGAATVGAFADLVPRLLTAPRPAPVTAELLLPGVLLVVVVALVVGLALAGRGRAFVAPAVGAGVLYTAGALLTAGEADRHGLVAVGLVGLLGVGWLGLDRAGRGRGRRGPAGMLVPQALLVLVLAGVAVVAAVWPSGDAFEPRTLVAPPVEDLEVASPLPQLASWAAAGDAELFRVTGAEVPLRLVALADYTGAAWRAASLYGAIGAVAPPELPDGARRVSVSVEVTVGGLAGPWLPTAGRPMETSAAAVVDPDSGSLVLPEGLRPGLSYDVRCTVDAPDDTDLLNASVPGGEAARRYLALPGLPFSLAEYARRTVANAKTPFERAVAIEEVVRAGRRPDAEAPVGSSYARLETFLFGAPGTAGANAGTAEQFASAFAVLARAVGLPARVVVGFRPVPPGEDGVTIVRGQDVTAWPEVYFAGWGWVPFDPVSGTDTGPSSASRREVINRLATPTPTPSTPDTTGPPLPLPGPEPGAEAAAGDPAGRSWTPLLLIGLVPVQLAAVLGVLRAVRRARLRRAGATGAWAYVLDTLLLADRSPARHRPAPDIARDVARLAPAAPRLAELADRAAFAPGPMPHQLSYAAWPLALQVRASLRRVVPWYRRLWWAVDPRPLWRR